MQFYRNMEIMTSNCHVVALLASITLLLEPVSGYSEDVPQRQKKCSLYLAKSTIPNAGLGVFTSIPLEKHQIIGYSDLAIPIVDIDFHNNGEAINEDYHWLLDEYNWRPSAASWYMETEAEMVSAYIPGMGAMPNCHMRLMNIYETHTEYDTAGVTRNDPGIGAFTGYYNRRTFSISSIRAGQELFVDYGSQWFLTRENYMGLMPQRESYVYASKFLNKLKNLLQTHWPDAILNTMDEIPASFPEETNQDLWDIIVSFPFKSRPQSALPKAFAVAQKAMDSNLLQIEVEEATRTLEYLETNGKCLDNIRPGNSTIPNAGRGAFATRFLPKGSLVAPAPLLHIPDRNALNMYADKLDSIERDFFNLTGYQLLLNYCFGHKSSSILLCPYGSGTHYINHNSRSPNAKITWSEDLMYHNSSWLNEPVSFFDNAWQPGVAFEYIALRDIDKEEEITINYGAEWEDAWNKHVRNWIPSLSNAVTPQELNEDQVSPLRTFAEDKTLYGDDIDLYCVFAYSLIMEEEDEWEDETGTDEHKVHRIHDRVQQPDGGHSFLYTIEIIVEPDGKYVENRLLYKVNNVPREAMTFYYKNYRSDMFIKGAFRHEMMISDEMFPSAWRNSLI